MGTVVGDIAIQVGADIGPLVTQLGKASGAVSKFGKDAQASGGGMALASKAGIALGGAVVAAGAAMVSFTRAAMNNIDALSKQARIAGVSVATFQAMSLVAEEAGVSSEALSKSLVKMQDNLAGLSRGAAAQVAAFGQIGVSFADVQGMATDEQFALIAEKISAISDPTMRTAAALDVFGKSGADALNMMTGYGTAIQNAAAFQEKFGLAVSDTDAANIEAANDALGRAQIAIGSLGTELAVTFAPAIEQVAIGLQNLVADIFKVDTALQDALGGEAMARAILGEELYNKLNASAEAFRDNASAVGELRGTLETTAIFADQAAVNFGYMAQRLQQVGQLDLASKFANLSEEIQQTNDDWNDGKIPLEEYRAKLEASRDQATQLIIEASKIDGVDLSNIRGQVAGLNKLLEIGARAAFQLRATLASGGAGGVGASASASGRFDLSSPLAPKTSTAPPRAPTNMDFGIDVWSGAGIGAEGSGGGSGGSDPMQARVDALVESLRTQSEIVNEWYIASQEALQAASDAELATIGGRQAAIERLEEEHQERLKGIKDAGNAFSVQSALDGGAMILGAMDSTNKKAMKLQTSFAAASALISAYQGAAKELERGALGFQTAALVIAKGISFVNAIKSAGNSASSGGGGGSSGGMGGGARAAASSTTETRTANINFYGGFQPTQETISMIAGGLNDWLGDGGRLNMGA